MPGRVVPSGATASLGLRRSILRQPVFLLLLLCSVAMLIAVITSATHASDCWGPQGRKHDILFLSYPKAGRTWLRYLVGS